MNGEGENGTGDAREWRDVCVSDTDPPPSSHVLLGLDPTPQFSLTRAVSRPQNTSQGQILLNARARPFDKTNTPP
ncbi:hypothetical protein AAFF_G00252510 [Aldrovandia affinis]|uniref:Uncharacterized protein n=1 Tax=Aldrovandia affinis TaxID=143900 RepID=A0AAD7STU2_9TELE|nr:hypothetical protein AAFF_G00252510 [Aldrovandia affinis]